MKWVSITLLVIATLAFAPGLSAAAPAAPFPEVIALPDGFQPEGIVSGRGSTLYAGSLVDGAIYQVDARTGQGFILVPGQSGRVAAGLDFDPRTGYLYVSGANTGQAYIYDTRSGATVAVFQLTSEVSFVNDAVVTQRAAYFTDSFRGVLYAVPLQPNGRPASGPVTEISLGPDFAPEPGAFKANGIVATPNGHALVVVNSALGQLYRVDPANGYVTQLDLGGATVPAGDGLLLLGHTLYVVQNALNQIAVLRVDQQLTSGQLVGTLSHPAFDVPTTVTSQGASLYAVNARFSTPPTPDTEYSIVRVDR